ncbi:unnamed protein product [Brassica oleracea]
MKTKRELHGDKEVVMKTERELHDDEEVAMKTERDIHGNEEVAMKRGEELRGDEARCGAIGRPRGGDEERRRDDCFHSSLFWVGTTYVDLLSQHFWLLGLLWVFLCLIYANIGL